MTISPFPVGELNRAVAVSMTDDPEAALAILDALSDEPPPSPATNVSASYFSPAPPNPSDPSGLSDPSNASTTSSSPPSPSTRRNPHFSNTRIDPTLCVAT